MAHELDGTIRVHQALHGYSDGHRMIASSTALKPRDQKTMLILSDVSGAGAGASLDGQGYLTGYPLPDSGVYAIARTWPAVEMARPGCVWTHTLLLDFSDLATLSGMVFISRAFRRPSPTSTDIGYGAQLSLTRGGNEPIVTPSARKELKKLFSALYGYPKAKVISDATDESIPIVLHLWAQQWPRLRRTFRFCTLAFADRSMEGTPFDLQFVPPRERSVRARFSDVIDADRTALISSTWLDDAAEDITSGNSGELRTFLKDVGGDIAGGREMFAPLCLLHKMIPTFGKRGDLIDGAISVINESFDVDSATSLRALLVSAVAQHPENITEQSASFLLSNLDLLKDGDISNETELGKAIWIHNAEKLLELAEGDSTHSGFAEATVKQLSLESLARAASQNSDLVPRLLALRPDLMNGPELWSIHRNWDIKSLLNRSIDPETVLKAMLQANRADLAHDAVDFFGSLRILNAISDLFALDTKTLSSEALSVWFDFALKDTPALAMFLNLRSDPPVSVFYEIAARTQPDSIPNDWGADPWITSIRKASGSLEGSNRQYLSAYLLARAFGYRSHSQPDLIEYAFDEVYFSALNGRLSEGAWGLLQRALPRSWFFDWDRCQKLRDAVTDMYVNRDLPPEAFARITRDNSLFAELSRLAAYTSRGRKYLKRVLRVLRDRDDSESRIKAIENVI